MRKTTLLKHPLHPQLVAAPLGLLPFSLVLGVMHRQTGHLSYSDASYYAMVGGTIGACAAGAAGAADYLAIPEEERHVKRTGNTHALLNLGALALWGASLFRRSRRPDRAPDGLDLALAAVGTAGMLISSWYGGEMVYEQGMRVRGVDPIARAREAKLPGDEQMTRPFERMSAQMTPADPLITAQETIGRR